MCTVVVSKIFIIIHVTLLYDQPQAVYMYVHAPVGLVWIYAHAHVHVLHIVLVFRSLHRAGVD